LISEMMMKVVMLNWSYLLSFLMRRGAANCRFLAALGMTSSKNPFKSSKNPFGMTNSKSRSE
jgi:hypothetical protein